jgi:hypothetical protein
MPTSIVMMSLAFANRPSMSSSFSIHNTAITTTKTTEMVMNAKRKVIRPRAWSASASCAIRSVWKSAQKMTPTTIRPVTSKASCGMSDHPSLVLLQVRKSFEGVQQCIFVRILRGLHHPNVIDHPVAVIWPVRMRIGEILELGQGLIGRSVVFEPWRKVRICHCPASGGERSRRHRLTRLTKVGRVPSLAVGRREAHIAVVRSRIPGLSGQRSCLLDRAEGEARKPKQVRVAATAQPLVRRTQHRDHDRHFFGMVFSPIQIAIALDQPSQCAAVDLIVGFRGCIPPVLRGKGQRLQRA